jgi:hypothetical protein
VFLSAEFAKSAGHVVPLISQIPQIKKTKKKGLEAK